MAEEYGDLLPEAARDWPWQFLESQNHPSALADHNVYIVTNDVVFPGLSGFPQEVQQEETPAVQLVVVENVAFVPGQSGFP